MTTAIARKGVVRGTLTAQWQLKRIGALPKPKQRAVMNVTEALLAQQGLWGKEER